MGTFCLQSTQSIVEIEHYCGAMPLYLVRHAKAGSRSAWIGDDRDRPLVEEGWEQARALVARIAPLQPSALLSSPYLRCVQTLQPLGEECELDVTIDTRLEEDSPLERSLAALDDAPDNAVLCSHGDVIPDVINGLLRRGMDLGEAPGALRKAGTFVLHRENGKFVRAEYWAPPKIN
jgi:8-oxo-dGTP diphosphatase